MGGRFVRNATQKFVDIPYGWELMKDPAVSAGRKLLSLAIGIAAVSILVALEMPLEIFIFALVPFFGGIADFLFDSLQILVLPGLVACAVLPYLVPKVRRAPVRI